jgi:hypothetical protein
MAFMETLTWTQRLRTFSRRCSLWYAFTAAAAIILALFFVLYELPAARHLPPSFKSTLGGDHSQSPAARPTKGFDGSWNSERDRNSLFLDRSQCRAAFPGLFDDIDRLVADRRSNPVTIAEMENLSGQEENWMSANTRDHAVGYIDNGNVSICFSSGERAKLTRTRYTLPATRGALFLAPLRRCMPCTEQSSQRPNRYPTSSSTSFPETLRKTPPSGASAGTLGTMLPG